MNESEVLEKALHLGASDKFIIIDELLKSLDKPDLSVDKAWEKEASSRLSAYKNGKVKTVSEQTFFTYER
ncbi:hypothetical protein SPONL_748 [uncultured Candidatus Thioglobus sp.]|nr:hypothetical protein SPONL_748 [uncultured Candidatus Thioglobus sp.]